MMGEDKGLYDEILEEKKRHEQRLQHLLATPAFDRLDSVDLEIVSEEVKKTMKRITMLGEMLKHVKER